MLKVMTAHTYDMENTRAMEERDQHPSDGSVLS